MLRDSLSWETFCLACLLFWATVSAPPVPARHQDPIHRCVGSSDSGCTSESGHQQYMLWWLPVAALHASDSSAGAPSLTIFSPLEGSIHGKGAFQLALEIHNRPAKLCMQALIDFEVEVDILVPGTLAGSREWPSNFDGMIPEEPGRHTLTLRMLSPSHSEEYAGCADVSEHKVIFEASLAFTIIAGSVRKHEIPHAFPPMELACTGALSHRIKHLCKSSSSPAANAAIVLHFTPWAPPSFRELSQSAGSSHGHSMIREKDLSEHCFLVTALAVVREQQDDGQLGVIVKGMRSTRPARSGEPEVDGAGNSGESSLLVVANGAGAHGCVSTELQKSTDGSEALRGYGSGEVHLRVSQAVAKEGGAATEIAEGDEIAIALRLDVGGWVAEHAGDGGGSELDGVMFGDGELVQDQPAGSEWSGERTASDALRVWRERRRREEAVEAREERDEEKAGDKVEGREERGSGQLLDDSAEDAAGDGTQREEGMEEGRKAVATLVLSEDYLAGAMVLFSSLRGACAWDLAAPRRDEDASCPHQKPLAGADDVCGPRSGLNVDLVMLVSTRLRVARRDVEDRAGAVGASVRWVEPIRSPHQQDSNRTELLDTYSKLYLWDMTEYRRVLYLDADVLVFGCPKLLFSVHEFAVMGCPTGPPKPLWQFNIDWEDDLAIGTGMMVLTPDGAEFARLIEQAQSAESFDGADRGLIHTLLPDYKLAGPNVVAWGRTAMLHRALWTDLANPIMAVDFTGRPKPWEALDGSVDPVDKGNYLPLVLEWWVALPACYSHITTLQHYNQDWWTEYWRAAGKLPPASRITEWPQSIPPLAEDPAPDSRRGQELQEADPREHPAFLKTLLWYKREVESVSEEFGCSAAGRRLLVYQPGFYTPDEAYAAFSRKHPIGIGNRMVQVASAWILAVVTQRRLLIRWEDPQGRDLTDYLVPADLDWDLLAFVARHPECEESIGALLEAGQPEAAARVVVSEADVRQLLAKQSLLDDRGLEEEEEEEEEFVVVYSPDKLCPACRPLFNRSMGDAAHQTLLSNIPSDLGLVLQMREGLPVDLFFFLLGPVLRALFKLSSEMETEYRQRWWSRADPSGNHTVGVQIRRGRWHMGSKSAADDRGLLDADGETHLLQCAKALARPDTRYFLVTDDITARDRAVKALAPHRVHYLESPIVHSGLEGQGSDGQRGVFLDWWVLGDLDDAVLSDSSSFGYTAAARGWHWGGTRAAHAQASGWTLPVTVWNSDVARGLCRRRVWGYCKRNCHTNFINAAEIGFEPSPDLPL